MYDRPSQTFGQCYVSTWKMMQNPNENENFARDDRSRSNPSQDRFQEFQEVYPESDRSLSSACLVLFSQPSEQKAGGYWG